MSIRIVPDKNQPSAAIEIPLEKPLPDYDLHQLEQPTPRDIDAILVSQGFRDLVDDARGVLTDLISGTGLEIAQFTGAICPDDEETYRPCLWIVLRDANTAHGHELTSDSRARISAIATELVNRLQLASFLDLSRPSPHTLIFSPPPARDHRGERSCQKKKDSSSFTPARARARPPARLEPRFAPWARASKS